MKVTRHRKARLLRHKIHMPDGIWTYQIGSSGATIRNPECELTAKIDMPELTGWSWPDLEHERFEHRRYPGVELPQVKPSDIRSLILSILNGEYEIKPLKFPKKLEKRRREGLRSSR